MDRTIRHYVEFAQVPCLSELASEGTDQGKLRIMSLLCEEDGSPLSQGLPDQNRYGGGRDHNEAANRRQPGEVKVAQGKRIGRAVSTTRQRIPQASNASEGD